jgi:hypothetical protein
MNQKKRAPYRPDKVLTHKTFDPSLLCVLPKQKNSFNSDQYPISLDQDYTLCIQLQCGGRIRFINPVSDKPFDKEARSKMTKEEQNMEINQAERLSFTVDVQPGSTDEKLLLALQEWGLQAAAGNQGFWQEKSGQGDEKMGVEDLRRFRFHALVNPGKPKSEDKVSEDGTVECWPPNLSVGVNQKLQSNQKERAQGYKPLLQNVLINNEKGQDLATLSHDEEYGNLDVVDLKEFSWKRLILKIPHFYSQGRVQFGFTKYLRALQLGERRSRDVRTAFVDDDENDNDPLNQLPSQEQRGMKRGFVDDDEDTTPPPLETAARAAGVGACGVDGETKPGKTKRHKNK